MTLTLTCCVGGASYEDRLVVSVADGNMVDELGDPLTSSEDEETRSEWSKLGR